MKLLPFKHSNNGSIGVEIEFQLIDIEDFSLISRAQEILRKVDKGRYKGRFKPEITQSMLEINSSIHDSPEGLFSELLDLQSLLKTEAQHEHIGICGGGTHPFRTWYDEKIFPSKRHRDIFHTFRYLCYRAGVFGQHVHVGCKHADDAIYLTHAFARYAPQFIALSASSPFYQGIDTGYASSRVPVFNAFPLSGVMPYFKNWQAFSEYFYRMKRWGVINSMKDVYWDIRPKPEFGTVEIRLFDTPLSIKKSVMLAAYVQALALYLLTERPDIMSQDVYYLYDHNRFQACRYGHLGEMIDPNSNQAILIMDDIIKTIHKIEHYAGQLGSRHYLEKLQTMLIDNAGDVACLRAVYKNAGTFEPVIAEQYRLWNTPYEG